MNTIAVILFLTTQSYTIICIIVCARKRYYNIIVHRVRVVFFGMWYYIVYSHGVIRIITMRGIPSYYCFLKMLSLRSSGLLDFASLSPPSFRRRLVMAWCPASEWNTHASRYKPRRWRINHYYCNIVFEIFLHSYHVVRIRSTVKSRGFVTSKITNNTQTVNLLDHCFQLLLSSYSESSDDIVSFAVGSKWLSHISYIVVPQVPLFVLALIWQYYGIRRLLNSYFTIKKLRID